MLRTFFDFRRVSTLIALLLIIALAAVMFASAPAATQTSPADATATPTATGTATATPTPTATGTATATLTPTATATPDPDATATPTPTATATPTATPTADPNATATPTATATATATPTVPPANADYDVDNDGLIEIRTLPQLNAVRYDLNGNGKQDSVSASDWATYTTAFLNAASDMGCQLTDHDSDAATPQQATCTGYELMMDLDFDTNSDGRVDATDANSYANWTPIGVGSNPFNATFKGSISNGVMPKISNLTISGSSTDAGLFGAIGSDARIESVGIVDANISVTSSSQADIGALAGSSAGGKVTACYSTGAITATAGAGSYAGGLIGYQSTTASTAASFSRATVSMAIDPAVTDTSLMYIYAGGLAGHNSGTITAAYAAGAVKGKGGSSSYIGGLVGDNNGTITASYSIAPVTFAAGSAITLIPGGLVGYNDGTNGRITASYWDFITSGIDDASPTTMPQGKSTRDLMSPTSASGIYAGWNTLTIDTVGANNDNPWNFGDAKSHPLLTYGGHTTALSGNQRFAYSGISSLYGGSTAHPKEGMTLYSALGPFIGLRADAWRWQSSADGIAWTTLAPIHGISRFPTLGVPSTYRFVPRPDDEGKYIRAKVELTTDGYAYTRAIGKIKAAVTANAVAVSFASGHNPPRIGAEITVAPLPSGAVGAWYRCAPNDANPSGCERVGTLVSYTPGGSDIYHSLRAYIYYKDTGGVWKRASTGFTQWVRDVQRTRPWRLE